MRSVIKVIAGWVHTLFTGGLHERMTLTSKERKIEAWRQQREKDFAKYGGTGCKICGKRIPGNKTYCGSCYVQYRKK